MTGKGQVPGFLAFAIAAALAFGAACKKDEKAEGDKEGAGKATANPSGGGTGPAVAAVVGEALIKRKDDCWRLVETWDKFAFADCYSDKPDVTYVDAVLGPPKSATRNDAVVEAGTFRNEYPTFKADRVAILVSGNKSLVVVQVNAKHKAGKPVSVYQVELAEHDPQGRIVKAEYYRDEATILSQLGVLQSALAPSTEKPWDAPVRQVAKDDDAERGNLAVVKKGLEALSKGEVAAALAMYAGDAVLRYVPEGKPYTDADIEARLKASADLKIKLALGDAWAAGDWVVATLTSSADDGKGKPWSLRSLELFQLQGGKVKQHWIFANSIKWARDVGQFDPSMVEGP